MSPNPQNVYAERIFPIPLLIVLIPIKCFSFKMHVTFC